MVRLARGRRATSGGNYLHYGVREFGMAAIMNGLALHGGFIPYGGTFLTFSDYCRNALRMAALMRMRSIFVFTHDSIGLGEDGPTHQPIEHARHAAADSEHGCLAPVRHRGIGRRLGGRDRAHRRPDEPGLQPAESAVPVATARSRWKTFAAAATCWWNRWSEPRAVIIATGSEVALAVEAQKALASGHVPVRVVSMPSTTVFDRQDADLSRARAAAGLPCVAVEAGASDLWRKYVGRSGAVIGIDRFGESAPADDLFRHFGFMPERVVDAVMQLLSHD